MTSSALSQRGLAVERCAAPLDDSSTRRDLSFGVFALYHKPTSQWSVRSTDRETKSMTCEAAERSGSRSGL
jgi:hypothetical protein